MTRKDATCPQCDRVSLTHTGAFWICPRCGLMITKHALAAELTNMERADCPDTCFPNSNDRRGTGQT